MKKLIFFMITSVILTGCASTVKQAQVVPGMDQQSVQLAWGNPSKIERNSNSCCKMQGEEAWYYFDSNPHAVYQPKYVFFKNDEVKVAYVFKK